MSLTVSPTIAESLALAAVFFTYIIFVAVLLHATIDRSWSY